MVSARQKRKIYSQARCDDCCLLYQRAKGLAEEFNITDSLGKRWNFQTHQFRHTVELEWLIVVCQCILFNDI